MSTLNKRLVDLEQKHQTTKGPLLILRRCISPEGQGSPMDVATFGPHSIHRASDETEAQFVHRVTTAAREHYGQRHGVVVLMSELDLAL